MDFFLPSNDDVNEMNSPHGITVPSIGTLPPSVSMQPLQISLDHFSPMIAHEMGTQRVGSTSALQLDTNASPSPHSNQQRHVRFDMPAPQALHALGSMEQMSSPRSSDGMSNVLHSAHKNSSNSNSLQLLMPPTGFEMPTVQHRLDIRWHNCFFKSIGHCRGRRRCVNASIYIIYKNCDSCFIFMCIYFIGIWPAACFATTKWKVAPNGLSATCF